LGQFGNALFRTFGNLGNIIWASIKSIGTPLKPGETFEEMWARNVVEESENFESRQKEREARAKQLGRQVAADLAAGIRAELANLQAAWRAMSLPIESEAGRKLSAKIAELEGKLRGLGAAAGGEGGGGETLKGRGAIGKEFYKRETNALEKMGLIFFGMKGYTDPGLPFHQATARNTREAIQWSRGAVVILHEINRAVTGQTSLFGVNE
jgi:hypothetical protein